MNINVKLVPLTADDREQFILDNQDKIYVLVQILILPEYQNKGLAQQAIKKVESLYPDAEYWRLDTIAQEDKLCHLYSKMGYQKTGEIEHIKDGMDIVFFEKQMVH